MINVIFFLIVAATVVFALWLSHKYKERYAEFPWWKVGVIIVIEVVTWVVVKWIFSNFWLTAIAAAIIIIVLLTRKKREDQTL